MVKTREALGIASRLEAVGVIVRSRELEAEAKAIREFHERGGNRAMRRAAAKAARRRS